MDAVRRAVRVALAEDLGGLGDLSAALVPSTKVASLAVVSRQEGVVGGEWCAREVFGQLDDTLKVLWHLPDGSSVAAGDSVAEVTGTLRSILTAERTALNFLGRLSGIATLTRRPACSTPARPPPACARWRRRPSGRAGGTTTGSGCSTRC
jgi:nicotinate-nucleotide pyrophosphorylase (carboxylating)